MSTAIDIRALERLHAKYNRREFVAPDPLQFLYDYDDPLDREIVGLVASSLAYGKVQQILRSVSTVLERMPSPARFLRRASRGTLTKAFANLKHRFTTGEQLAAMLFGAKRAVERHGSLHECFTTYLSDKDDTILPALCGFVHEIASEAGGSCPFLLPSPSRGSACKRLNLFLRWMVRQDDVDPGGWRGVSPSRLVVPLDIHMYRISLALGITRRKQANLRTALEITAAFRRIAPEDPVKYDFALTRPGIRREQDAQAFLAKVRLQGAA